MQYLVLSTYRHKNIHTDYCWLLLKRILLAALSSNEAVLRMCRIDPLELRTHTYRTKPLYLIRLCAHSCVATLARSTLVSAHLCTSVLTRNSVGKSFRPQRRVRKSETQWLQPLDISLHHQNCRSSLIGERPKERMRDWLDILRLRRLCLSFLFLCEFWTNIQANDHPYLRAQSQ